MRSPKGIPNSIKESYKDAGSTPVHESQNVNRPRESCDSIGNICSPINPFSRSSPSGQLTSPRLVSPPHRSLKPLNLLSRKPLSRTLLRLLVSGMSIMLLAISSMVLRPSYLYWETMNDGAESVYAEEKSTDEKERNATMRWAEDTQKYPLSNSTNIQQQSKNREGSVMRLGALGIGLNMSAIDTSISDNYVEKRDFETLKSELMESVALAAAEAIRTEMVGSAFTRSSQEHSNASPEEKPLSDHVNPAFRSGGRGPECRLDPMGPVPVALVTLGRSGSSSMWQVMGTLTGLETPYIEYTGSDPKQSKRFFNFWSKDNNGNWALRYFCRKQRQYPKAGIVGFKWKPFKESFTHPQALAGLRMIAGSYDPQIKVVRSKRNLLDRYLSGLKHRQAEKTPAHCMVGDESCIKAHQQVASGLVVPIPDMLRQLEKEYSGEIIADRVLKELGVPHVEVSFEKLFYGDFIEIEWARIFQFLGVGPTDALTREMVESAMKHAATSNPFHNQTIANFEEVREALKGTTFENLLH